MEQKENKPYGSREDTREHVLCVQKLMTKVIKHVGGKLLLCGAREGSQRVLLNVMENLTHRLIVHDDSKFRDPEKPVFDRVTPLLKKLKYGSPEYKDSLKDMGPALQHHYQHNSHHPEYYSRGILGMSLLDLLEMLCDWKAATLRMADGNIMKSMEINILRFSMDPGISNTLLGTIDELGFDDTVNDDTPRIIPSPGTSLLSCIELIASWFGQSNDAAAFTLYMEEGMQSIMLSEGLQGVIRNTVAELGILASLRAHGS